MVGHSGKCWKIMEDGGGQHGTVGDSEGYWGTGGDSGEQYNMVGPGPLF